MIVSDLHTDDLRDLYRDLILDHARNPRHFGKLARTTHSAEGINPLCGDKLKLYLDVDSDEIIKEAAFEGSGCAISVASASLLTDTVIGLSSIDAMAFFDAVTSQLAGDERGNGKRVDLGKLRALAGVRDYPTRVKCATLAWHALKSALRQDTAPASTE
ncbi:MAG: SUF system NifU family Fe-S cluster assembly protein [Gammaproteobacteria bacterium]|jgi:nitrogen fixation NifU-like protein|nr:SUF system NifU family Fe-S cluster assembly protein [Gammaproteobacteria bacterium]